MRRMTVAAIVGAALLVAVGWLPFQRYRLDREVDRLCAIDGGVHIYETVTLPKENFGPNGEVFPQYRGVRTDRGRYGPDYSSSLTVEVRLQARGTCPAHGQLPLTRAA
jgi:hypothetical protein